ncbi:hypothetical protein PR048_000735 [Dryococelus australis]|uniref:Uncharacterized protein n=1 Tax=Dryococelus australis TaxID=614101 RepID=A0ABQ9IHU4_9NEOP|nr:hypothetical protein PR048_000735 [Dryococelus australis]
MTVKKLKRKVEKLKKQCNRMKEKEQMKCQKRLQEFAPRKRVEEIMHSKPEILKRKLLQGEVVCEHLSKSIQEMKGPGSEGNKKSLHKILRGKIIEKIQTHFLSQFLKGGRVKTNYKKGREKKQNDCNSRILPRKNGVIKSESGRKQVRCLEDDMNNLYEKFKKANPSKRENINYSTFARYRPKWVKKLDVDER